jgi:hypothetical protein
MLVLCELFHMNSVMQLTLRRNLSLIWTSDSGKREAVAGCLDLKSCVTTSMKVNNKIKSHMREPSLILEVVSDFLKA